MIGNPAQFINFRALERVTQWRSSQERKDLLAKKYEKPIRLPKPPNSLKLERIDCVCRFPRPGYVGEIFACEDRLWRKDAIPTAWTRIGSDKKIWRANWESIHDRTY